MSMPFGFSDAAASERLFQMGLDLIVANATLPSQVFRSDLQPSRWIEFMLLLSRKAWSSLLLPLALIHRDKKIAFVSLAPATDAFSLHRGRFVLAATCTDEDYYRHVSFEEEPPAALSDLVDRIAIFGDSLRWAIWGDRDDNLGVYGSCDGGKVLPMSKYFLTQSTALEIAALGYRGGELPAEMKAELLRNYAGCGGREAPNEGGPERD